MFNFLSPRLVTSPKSLLTQPRHPTSSKSYGACYEEDQSDNQKETSIHLKLEIKRFLQRKRDNICLTNPPQSDLIRVGRCGIYESTLDIASWFLYNNSRRETFCPSIQVFPVKGNSSIVDKMVPMI